MHPNITSLIAAERSQELVRRGANFRVAESTVKVSRVPRARHARSGAARRYFRRPGFAR